MPQIADVRRPSYSAALPAAAQSGRGPRSLHIPSLDGLRAVSFFIVFIAHSNFFIPFVSGIPGGFGVTVFFFLSGFLITTLLRIELESTGTVNVRHFYLRRALRILPPFYLILFLATILTLLRALPGRLNPAVVLAQSFHFSNYWFIWKGFNGAPAGTVPYWSLAVEEHFYLVFPFIYLGLNQWLSRGTQARALWTLCAVVCAWRCVLVLVFGVIEDRTYMASDTRVDSILFGCALALAMNPVLDRQWGSDRLWKWVLFPAGLAVLLVTFMYRAPWFRETIRYSLQGIALTPLFVAAMTFPKWLPFRLLNARPVAFVGVLSYTLYLIHQVVINALFYWLPSMRATPRAILAFAIAFAMAVVVHRLVEVPCARIRNRLGHAAPVARLSPGRR